MTPQCAATSISFLIHLPASLLTEIAQAPTWIESARVIGINLGPTELSGLAQISLRGKTGELLSQIVGQTS